MRRRKQFKQSLSLFPPKREFTYEKPPGLKSREEDPSSFISSSRSELKGNSLMVFYPSLSRSPRYDKCKINVEDTLRRILTR